MSRWKNNRLGLIMISASLFVIAVILAYLFINQQRSTTEQLRSQGLNIVRLLANVPFEQLMPGNRQHDLLQLLGHLQNNAHFAYAAIVDSQNKLITDTTTPGVIVPHIELTDEPSTWLGERRIQTNENQRSIIEFHAPLLHSGEYKGQVRLGYFQPSYGIDIKQLPFYASLALPIFLLTPLFYFLVHQEVKPLHQISNEIEKLKDNESFKHLQISPTDDLKDFIDNFNKFSLFAKSRILELESEQLKQHTSSKVLSYKKGKIESALNALPDALMVIDNAGVTTYINSKLQSLLNVESDKIIGKKITDWCTNSEIISFVSKHQKTSGRTYHGEGMQINPDTAPDKTFALSSYPLFSPNDAKTMLGSLLVLRDISSELVAKKASSEFVAHIAHELKTPLNTLGLYSESLLDGAWQDHDYLVESVNVISDEVERLSSLISNLLSITKIEMGSVNIERQRVKFRELLTDAFENISRNDQEQNIQFNLNVPEEMSAISIDKDLFRIAINNLLTNAIKYNNPGGSVTLTAEETDREILVNVKDTGIGISQEDQQKIFDKFYRAQNDETRKRPGHGLGLALARDIIQLHHGKLMVTSNAGEGTEFTIVLRKEYNLLKKAI